MRTSHIVKKMCERFKTNRRTQLTGRNGDSDLPESGCSSDDCWLHADCTTSRGTCGGVVGAEKTGGGGRGGGEALGLDRDDGEEDLLALGDSCCLSNRM